MCLIIKDLQNKEYRRVVILRKSSTGGTTSKNAVNDKFTAFRVLI
jgi:hypothetical protein